MTSKFDEFVKAQQVADTFDVKAELAEWLRYIQSFFDRAESYLEPYIKEGSIGREYEDVELNEEQVGAYQTRKMVLHIGRKRVDFTPVGTFIIGAKGRIDLKGPAGRARLVLVDKNASAPSIKVSVSINPGKSKKAALEEAALKIDWDWKWVTSPPAVKYIELNAETFQEAILEVAQG